MAAYPLRRSQPYGDALLAEFNSDDQGSADNPDSSGLSGSEKLKSLLEKSRAVARSGDVEDFDEEPGLNEETSPDSETSVVSGDIANNIPQLPLPPSARPASASGSIPAAQSAEVPAARSGEVPAARSGEVPAAQSGDLAAASQSYSGPIAAPENSGPIPTPSSSGSFQMNPNASYSGPLPVMLQSGLMQSPYESQSVPLSPSGEFGIVPDIGVSQSNDEIPVSEAPSAKKRRLRAVAVTVIIGLVAFVIVARLIVDQWVTPGRAVIWMAAGTFIPTALVGIILAWPNRENGSLKDTLSGLVPAVALSAAAVIAAGSWSQGDIRAQAVPFVPETPQLMATILDDESPKVALAGCERFGKRYDDTDFRTRLFATLTLRPSLAMDCMERLSEEARVAVATSLSDRWTRELLADEKQPDKARLCATAGGLSSLTIDPAEVRGRLLQCALNAPNEVAQQCCADSLATTVVDPKQWAKHLRETIPYAQDPYTSTGVFAMAFHQEGLSAPQKAFAKKVEFQSPQAQLASLEFACDSVGNGSANVVRHMQAALDGECPVDAGNVPASESVWQEICFLTIAEIEADRTRPPVATMCAMTREVVTREAVLTASELVRLALRRDLEGSLARKIEGGYNMLLDSVAQNTEERPDFIGEDEVMRARQDSKFGYEDEPNDNRRYAAPGDDEFQAFLKAYKAQEPWKDAKKRFQAEQKRKAAKKQ